MRRLREKGGKRRCRRKRNKEVENDEVMGRGENSRIMEVENDRAKVEVENEVRMGVVSGGGKVEAENQGEEMRNSH